MQHCQASGPLPDRRAPVICTGIPALSAALWTTEESQGPEMIFSEASRPALELIQSPIQ